MDELPEDEVPTRPGISETYETREDKRDVEEAEEPAGRIVVTYPKQKKTPEQRISQLEEIVKSFKVITAGISPIVGFPKLRKAESLEERLSALEKAHEEFSFFGGAMSSPGVTIEGSLETGFAVNVQCPEEAEETGVVPPSPPPPPPICDCCFANRIQFTATVTATFNCGGSMSCPCDGGDFLVNSDTLVADVSDPCATVHAFADGGTDFTCSCPTGSPNSDSHAEITINLDGMGGCQLYVQGWIDILNCGGVVSRRMGLDHVSDSMTCGEVFGTHDFDFSGFDGDGDAVHVVLSAIIS